MEDRKWGRRRCWGWRGEKQQMEEEEEGRVSIRGSRPALGSERRIMKLETSFFSPSGAGECRECTGDGSLDTPRETYFLVLFHFSAFFHLPSLQPPCVPKKPHLGPLTLPHTNRQRHGQWVHMQNTKHTRMETVTHADRHKLMPRMD